MPWWDVIGIIAGVSLGCGSILVALFRAGMSKRDALAFIWAVTLAAKFDEEVDLRYLAYGYQLADRWLKELP